MKYARMINRELVFARNPILCNGYWIGNPQPAILIEMGYKSVYFAPCPEPLTDTGYWVSTWTEDEQRITQAWTWYEPPIS